jgi:excisionase family DNA binding protein
MSLDDQLAEMWAAGATFTDMGLKLGESRNVIAGRIARARAGDPRFAPRPLSPPLAVRPMEAARLLGISRSRLYQLLKSGAIRHRKDGAATLIPYEDLIARLNSLPTVTPEEQPTGPLLLAAEPSPEPSAPNLAAVYASRFKLIVGNVGPDEARLRAFEHTVGVCRTHYRVDLESAKKMVSDAIKAAR